MTAKIVCCAAALRALGIREGERIALALPNCPQAVCLLYAVNLVGAVAVMIHPLAAEKELEYILNDSDSALAVVLDISYEKLDHIRQGTRLKNVVLMSLRDELPLPLNVAYSLKNKPSRVNTDVLRWKPFSRMLSARLLTTSWKMRNGRFGCKTRMERKIVMIQNKNEDIFNAFAHGDNSKCVIKLFRKCSL